MNNEPIIDVFEVSGWPEDRPYAVGHVITDGHDQKIKYPLNKQEIRAFTKLCIAIEKRLDGLPLDDLIDRPRRRSTDRTDNDESSTHQED